MASGIKTGGRLKGTPNKATREVEDILRSLNCNPIEGMVGIATDQSNTPELRGKMYSELARYIYPQRKAVEHSGGGESGEPFTVIISSVLDRDKNHGLYKSFAADSS